MQVFTNTSLNVLGTVCTYLPMAILIPIMNKLIDRFGKKELCAFGIAFASIASFVLFFIKTGNPYVFLVFTFLSGLGQTFLVLEIWALVMDVIDYHEIRTHRTEEGTAYAFISFTRKLGQTLAGVGLNALLAVMPLQTVRHCRMMCSISFTASQLLFLLSFSDLWRLYSLSDIIFQRRGLYLCTESLRRLDRVRNS